MALAVQLVVVAAVALVSPELVVAEVVRLVVVAAAAVVVEQALVALAPQLWPALLRLQTPDYRQAQR